MPGLAGRANDQRVGAVLRGRGGEFPGWRAAPGSGVHLQVPGVAHLVQFGEQPAADLLVIAGCPDDLPA